MTYRLVFWDWRAQPDWAEVSAAVRELSGEGTHAGPVTLHEVPDTGGDFNALVIADEAEDLTDERAQAIFDAGPS